MRIFGKSYGTKICGQVFINGKEVHLDSATGCHRAQAGLCDRGQKRRNGLILSSNSIKNEYQSWQIWQGISNGRGHRRRTKSMLIAVEYRRIS